MLKIIIILYGVLSLVAAIAQSVYKNITMKSGLIMGIGGILIISSMFISTVFSIYLLILGVLLTHISAIINGYKIYGEVNKSQNLIRFAISLFIIISYVLIN